ncbi:DUF2945 domain-containing protein [Burkholderia sp. Ac-20365]|jgi:hypothetical protein|uniref:DUF2945 domain-containing protein n=1 Tax=Burkholderia sp. Ac-20365 TaxID=2703897 RepID=UPI00197BF377|nr:DUF2945 domain-containing protein [Burkholderia sp. Ac-20365]MBN3767046.1 DUF2945 domain-containing protein [Burkholderia sp. Ac-20365]
MKHDLKPGDRVNWNTPQGMTTGIIVRAITTHTELDGHTVAATKDDVHYEVESEKSGKRAVHRAQALHRVSKH